MASPPGPTLAQEVFVQALESESPTPYSGRKFNK